MFSLCPKTFIYPTSSFSHHAPLLFSFHFFTNPFTFHPRISALKASASDGDNVLGKPLIHQGKEFTTILDEQGDNDIIAMKKTKAYAYEEVEEDDDDDDSVEEEKWVDWEDQILEDTVPLVGFVRMILHSGKYESGERLTPEHEKVILEKLLPFHPEHAKKIGCGIDYITIGYHPNFDRSRCLFIVRKDGELVDFSFWKCIKGLIRMNYPLYADSFILRHFRKRSPSL
ncbi:hypothetical protein TanjilG_30588 [Lupinus angustifolius]|uniref:Protein DCL n=1 Tax=Lupinus angustifolius TaxID=3871 RepID=A0A1J7IKU4_LUPAN|nr:PREDICTED: protein DCL, chloroplastic-like [Lupinus angustifolius]XP_019437972.1 PREDICTED: protein DCL, chloroplastic [Lupinus angustifolius]OIV89712.1 hypothetical protein TanjilG_03810 [Lupinus angustifolius]OIW14869.1 hypothetical protein TanjilG_30588 [Lupinus angustifolius]